MLNQKLTNEDKISLLNTQDEDSNNLIKYGMIRTFKNIGRRGSKYNLLEEAKTFHLNNEYALKKKEKENSVYENTLSSMTSLFSKEESSTPKKEEIKIKKNLSSHKYVENKLPVITNSEQINNEIEKMNKRNNYYMKYIGNDNFGYKYVRHNPAYQSYDKKDEEEFIQLMGLNDEEKDPNSVINNKMLKINEKLEMKSENAKYLLIQLAQKKIRAKDNKEKENYKQKDGMNIYDFLLKNKHNKKLSKKKKEVIYSLMKKDEFSDFLIINYLKSYFPNLLKNKESFKKDDIFPKINRTYKLKKNKYEKRKIFVIKDSTIVSNPSHIPGFIAEIPSIKEMKSYSGQKRILIMRQFYEFVADKFRSHLTFKYIYLKDRTSIVDFVDLPENHKYIFVSPTGIFQGLSIPLNKNVIQLYLKHFSEEEDDNFYFNESSFENTIENEKYFKTNDDVFDIFLKPNNEKPKMFPKRIINKKNIINLESSFTFGIEENKYEYLYYSDDEKRKKDFNENQYKFFNNKLDFYIQSQNELFDKKIKQLLSKLETNKDGSIKNIQKFNKYKKSKNELVECYLTEKKNTEKKSVKI